MISEVASIVSALPSLNPELRRVLASNAELEPGEIVESFVLAKLSPSFISGLRERAVSNLNIDVSALSLLLVIYVSERDFSSSPSTNTCFNIAALLPLVLPSSGGLAIRFAKEHLETVDSKDETCWYLFTSMFKASYKTQCVEALSEMETSLDGEGLARCEHLLAMLTREGESTKKASPLYVASVFDKLAPVFESRLKGLGYDVPERVAALVKERVSIVGKPRIVDLGCGTGLVGELLVPLVRENSLAFSCLNADYRDKLIKVNHLRSSIDELLDADPEGKDEDFVSARSENAELVERYEAEAKTMKEKIDETEILDMYDFKKPPMGSMFGVDLSKEMVKIATAKNCYTSVALSDCDDYLVAQDESSADVIVSADTYIYMGDIETSFRESRRVLKEGGYLVFSIEVIFDDVEAGFSLLQSGRYGQSKSFVERLAEKYKFQVDFEEDVVIRKEQQEDILGKIFVLRGKVK